MSGVAIDYQKIVLAFRNAVATLPAIDPPLLWVDENRPVDADTVKSKEHLEEKMTPGPQPRMAAGYIEGNGIYIINIRTPKNSGMTRSRFISYLLRSCFMPGNVLVHENYEVIVDRAEEQMAYDDGDKPVFSVLPIYVRFRTYVAIY